MNLIFSISGPGHVKIKMAVQRKLNV